MNFYLNNNISHLFILGAGASIEYGLPVWSELSSLIQKKLTDDVANTYQYKKEILAWLDKIESKQYSTLDECITGESDQYHTGGVQIENELFRIMRDVFIESYKDSNRGWVEKLNSKILNDRKTCLEQRMSFVNYNYDHVLDNHFLNFASTLSDKKKLIHKSELNDLSRVVVEAFYPHGNFREKILRRSPITKHISTIKTGDTNYLDVVSCHDSQSHTISSYNLSSRKLYILGLGGGLTFNLNKDNLNLLFSEIHVTIHDKKLKDEIIEFLSKNFSIAPSEIKIYSSCSELIEQCF